MDCIDTVIVGAGQAGLATSYWLGQLGVEHVVLERAAHPASVWRDHRWDSFSLVTPNWVLCMPGAAYEGDDPDGYLPRSQVIDFFTSYVERFQLPVRFDTTVTSIESDGEHRFRVHTPDSVIEAANVVVATGFFQVPKVPAFASGLAPDIVQVHSDAYRNPGSLPDGAVLVVGSAMSGCQIAEDLSLAGRTVYLSIGGTGRAPRRYRGHDTYWWLEKVGYFDLTIEQFPPGVTRFDSHPHVTGANGGHTLNLHQFARDGVTLLGRMRSVDGAIARFAPDVHENLARADGFEAMVVQMIDGYVLEHGLDLPQEALPQLRDGFAQPVIERLDLEAAGVRSVVWATGYGIDYRFVKLPVFDRDGFPIQERGVTSQRGLHFAGLPWMPGQRSGSLLGVAESTRHVAASIAGALVSA